MALLKLEPWSSSSDNMNLDKSLTFAFIFITLFVLVSTMFIGGELSDIFKQQTYTIFLLFLLVISYSSMGAMPSIYGGLGTKMNLYKGLLFGGAIGIVFLVFSFFTLSIPELSIISSVQFISIFYAIVVVPFAEEKMFGQVVPFVLRRSLKNVWIAFFVTCAIFGAFHYFAYSSSGDNSIFIGGTLIAMIFRGLTLIGNEYLQTNAFGTTLHYFNNIVQAMKKLKTMGLI